MKKRTYKIIKSVLVLSIFMLNLTLQSCIQEETPIHVKKEKADYFSLRPEIEKAFGYTQAVKVGDIIKISGVVSMDDQGNPLAVGNMGQQIKNCYASLEKILKHYGCTFEDVIVENIYTTDMSMFLEQAAYRRKIYAKQFPTGTWLGVKELAIPVFMIEIELEVYQPA